MCSAIGRAGFDAVSPTQVLGPAIDAWQAGRTPGGGGAYVIAAGKAGSAMMRVYLDRAIDTVRGVLATTHVNGEFGPNIEIFICGHPCADRGQ